LRGAGDLALVGVSRAGEAMDCEAEEEYSCDSSGIVRVTVRNRSAAYDREYTLGRWSTRAPRATEAISVKHGWERGQR
jgi:hypothetical protein